MPQTIEEAIQAAVGHHEAGRLVEAEMIYRQVLAQFPDYADALHLLGALACQTGHLDEAIELIGQAIAISPESAAYHHNLGESYRRAERWEGAIASFRRAIELRPAYAESHNNLGLALYATGRLDEAIEAYRGAIEHNAGHVWAHVNLGNALGQQGRHDEALAVYTRVIALEPCFAEAHNSLGISLEAVGRNEEAIAAYRQVIALQSDHAWAHVNLANVLGATGRHDEAIAACRRALDIRANFAEAQNSLGVFLQAMGRTDEAVAAYEHAIALRPDFGEAFGNLATILKDVGRLDEALAACGRAIDLNPHSARDGGNRLVTLHFHPESDARSLLAEHREWARRYAEPLAPQMRPHANDGAPDRRLRVGFLSADFRRHPVGQLLRPLFAQRDRGKSEFIAYSDVRAADGVTENLKSLTDRWYDVAGQSDARLADRIRADQIDILVDLALHTAANRMLVFARKPAPVQVTMLGMLSTTGLATIDYRLTDPYIDPPGTTDADYCEHSIRLPHCFWCYEPAEGTPPVGALPAQQNGFITFGCLNQFSKVSRPAVELWVKILQSVPNSRLVLHAPAGSHRDAITARLREGGIAPDRITFSGRLSHVDYLARHHDLDLALDPFPYNGGATTLDALWMGVPVITLAGRTAVGRGGVSILSNLGLTELIARTPGEYVEIAVAVASDLAGLAHRRAALRERMQASPLMDAGQYAAAVEAAFRQMWRSWCGRSWMGGERLVSNVEIW
jgi:predicted O-linked N-acetylglucosamine transferase (SPINDLY family)